MNHESTPPYPPTGLDHYELREGLVYPVPFVRKNPLRIATTEAIGQRQ
jgi:hypothetical protein